MPDLRSTHMTLILHHNGSGAWSRYERDLDRWRSLTNPEPPIDDAPEAGYYADLGGAFKIGPFKSLQHAFAAAAAALAAEARRADEAAR
jgi:hypothetical protein